MRLWSNSMDESTLEKEATMDLFTSAFSIVTVIGHIRSLLVKLGEVLRTKGGRGCIIILRLPRIKILYFDPTE
ncbi:hypothetical protein YC2023_081280 [Brassica napus]